MRQQLFILSECTECYAMAKHYKLCMRDLRNSGSIPQGACKSGHASFSEIPFKASQMFGTLETQWGLDPIQ